MGLMKTAANKKGLKMANKKSTVERTVISVSLSVNDKKKLKEMAREEEMTSSALISQWIKEKYERYMRGEI